MAQFTLNVNGKTHSVDADPDMPLLYALRDDIGLNNPHFGCGLAQCGACTVHMDGQPVRSCITTVADAAGHRIVTLAGLGTPEKPHPLQTAYVEEQVTQCGYCINGWIMTAAAFLKDNKKPTDDQKITTLAGLGTPDNPHPLQKAYIEEEVPQCGYCINGWIMTAAAFLREKKKPTEDEIKQALEGLKCRCGTHMNILRAVKRAATMMG